MTVPEAGALTVPAPRGSGLAASSMWLLIAKGLQMGGGFVFWVLAARNASVETVGLAAASISAVMLCTQLGILGTGSAVIIELSRGEPVKQVLDAAFTVLTLAALAASLAYLGVVRMVGLDTLSAPTLAFATVFVSACCLGTAVICIDQASIALHHAGGAAPRYAAGAVAALTTAVTVSVRVQEMSLTVLLICWTVGSAATVLVGLAQLRAWTGYGFTPELHPPRVRRILRVGVPNQLLTASERLTPVLVPIILAHAASPTTTAYWYPAWMMAWVAFNAPISVGMVQFNDIARDPRRAFRVVRHGVGWSLGLGGSVSVAVALAAHPLLSLLGEAYADASVTALRILLIGLVPFTVLQAYNALCRGIDRTAEAIGLGAVLMVLVAVGAAVVGPRGTSAVALMWVGCTTLAACWAGYRLRSHLTSRSEERGR
jgi:O-antigen/teichoic acid export membrane protein